MKSKKEEIAYEKTFVLVKETKEKTFHKTYTEESDANLKYIISEAENVWNDRNAESSNTTRVEVWEIIEFGNGSIKSKKVVWLPEWYDAMCKFGKVNSGTENKVTAIEKPRYCKVLSHEFYQAYGMDNCGNRFLIEWRIDKDMREKGSDLPINYVVPTLVIFLNSRYDEFPKAPY